MSKEELVKAVLEKALEADGKKKLACVRIFELARELGVKPVEIGQICNKNDVKICKCQLGCF